MQPRPLPIESSQPIEVDSLTIAVIGHPWFDSRLDPFPKWFGFGEEFGIKRFSPGRLRELGVRVWRDHRVLTLLHDATTLSGSSGSCILDLESMRVLGLHFGGWPIEKRQIRTIAGSFAAQLFEANGAVPLWNLSRDRFCADVSFV
jgi:endonuclease G